MRKVLAILLPALLLLTACSGDDSSGPLSSVKVSSNGDGSVPTVEFDTPLTADEPTLVRVNDGDGEELTEGQAASIRLVALDPESGDELQETYTKTDEFLTVDDTLKQGNEQMYSALLGAPVGSDFAYYVPGNATGGSADQLLVFTLTGAVDAVTPLSQDEAGKRFAEGSLLMTQDETSALEEAGKLPEVSFGEDGKPSITIPDGVEEPEELIVKVLEEGSGPVLEQTGTVLANYAGVSLRDGTTFDSSYDRGEPTEFPLNGVVPGWTYGLTGQKAGSKVLLVLPSELAYGDPASSGRPSGPLVFVVDILEAK